MKKTTCKANLGGYDRWLSMVIGTWCWLSIGLGVVLSPTTQVLQAQESSPERLEPLEPRSDMEPSDAEPSDMGPSDVGQSDAGQSGGGESAEPAAEIDGSVDVTGAVASDLDDAEFGAADLDSGNDSTDANSPAANSANAPTYARRVRIKLPITGSSDLAAKQVVQQILDDSPRSAVRPIVVFEFWSPPGSNGAGSEFERSLSLARFLTGPSMQRVRTVAFVPRAVTGHAVLVVLACEQIIIAPDGTLGDAGERESQIGPTMRGGYTEIARSRRTIPDAVALGMLDKDLEISRVNTDTGVLYAWPEELAKIRAGRNDLQSVETLIPAGQRGLFRGDELRQLGFASYLATSHEEVASVLNVPPAQLEFDPSLGGDWRAIRVQLDGPVTSQAAERVMSTVRQQLDVHGVNFVCLQLDSPGGSVVESTRLANFLAELDPSRVRTVAYVSREARADAALIGFACDHLVMNPSAVLGGGGAVEISTEDADDMMSPIREIAKRKSKTWSLMASIVDPQLEVHRYSMDGMTETLYLCADEYAERFGEAAAVGDGAAAGGTAVGGTGWQQGETVTMPDEVLQVDGRQAQILGFSRFVVDSFDELNQLYQLPESPALIGPNWAFDLIDALASPQLSGLLLFIGGFALMSELSSPGLGIGGFLAAVCYMLFFWSNFLHGTAEVLEVMLFLTGLACIVIEIFLIPGFGVFGLGGAALVLVSFVLASQTFVLPTNDYQNQQLSQSMFTVAMAGAGIFTAAFLLRKYLHRLPALGNIMLLPPDDEGRQELELRETVVDHQRLVGQFGTVRTQLTPSGKAVLAGDVFDVISEGELIEKGSEIEVVEALGNRIIVRRRFEGGPTS